MKTEFGQFACQILIDIRHKHSRAAIILDAFAQGLGEARVLVCHDTGKKNTPLGSYNKSWRRGEHPCPFYGFIISGHMTEF